MRSSRSLVRAAVVAAAGGMLLGTAATAAAQPPADPVEYNRAIRPILSAACFGCHGPNEGARQADLRLDTPAFLDSHVVAGDPDGSLLFQRLTTGDDVLRMPPASSALSLRDDQLALIRRWIEAGAAWGDDQAPAPEGTAAALRTIDFDREVRPILSERCFTCHGPDSQSRQRGLRLDQREGVLEARAGFGGPVVVPGHAGESLLFQRISTRAPATRMPRGGEALSDDQIETIRLWIDQGAEWTTHWAFVPPERPVPPPVADTAWPRNPIDRFVLAGLERAGLTPSEEADRATLIRRVTLDLTGLPPGPEEISAFLTDDAPDAYEQVVDRLLGSPRYGERMAAEWLDAARYADTNGYQTDGGRTMWRWRDWVIDAYNANMPFDQFTIEQLAGDMLPDATRDQQIATAFNRNHSQNGEGGIVPEEFLVEYAVDRVETTSTVWLGLTLGCARCHDHKFDPISQTEFYEVFAHFNNVPERGKAFKYVNSPPFITAPTDEQQAELDELDAELQAARETFAEHETEREAAQRAWEESLHASVRLDWQIHEQLLAHFAFEGDVAGVPIGEPLPAVLEDGTPRFVDGRVGTAADFDGERFVEAGTRPDLEYEGVYTLAAWIKPTARDGVIVSRARGGDEGEVGWGLYLEDGKVRLNMSTRVLDDGVAAETEASVVLDEWQHVAATYDGSKTPGGMRIYLNGQRQELVPLLDLVGNISLGREPLRIGASGSDKPRFQGAIDDVRIYGTVLTPEQVAVVATGETIAAIAALPPERRTPGQADKIRLCFLDRYAPESIRDAWREVRDLERRRAELWDSFPTVMVMEEIVPRRPTFRLIRGAYDNPGDPVQPGVPRVLPPLAEGATPNRLAFARWLVDPGHPLTARVTVNRFWQMYFGTGLVKTAENFGTQGEHPSHPVLLDWLATSFIDSGWDVKALQRAIVTSATYRQASKVTPAQYEADPENRRLARGPRLRLPAPTIRDQALALAGLLVERVGGPSVKPYQPKGLWADFAFDGERDYEQSEGEDLWRRSLYTFWKRTLGPPTLMTFDASTRETCIVRRSRTNTPLQALNLMNDVTYVEAARRFAERAMREYDAPEDRVAYAYQLATAQYPGPNVHNVLVDALRAHQVRYRADRKAALALVSLGESPRDETLDVAEHAAYTMVASLILNLDGTITKE